MFTWSAEDNQFDFFDTPVYTTGGISRAIAPSDISYIDSPDRDYQFTILSVVDLESGEVETETILMGVSSTMYVSENAIYLTYPKEFDQEIYLQMYVDEVVYEVIPSSYADEITEILGSDKTVSEKREEIHKIIRVYLSGLSERELFDFATKFDEKFGEFSERVSIEMGQDACSLKLRLRG
jgi:uncharacterized secreted protein with C-terminal beta-propeller domain